MDTVAASTLAVVASVIFLIRLLPQPIRLARSGVAAGVSPLAALNALSAALAWLVYGLLAGLPAVWLVSLAAAVPGIWTVLLLRRQTRLVEVAIAGLWVGVMIGAASIHLFGAVLGAGVLVTQGPQVIRALRESDLRGLAPATWWICLPDALSWGAYGLVIGDGALMGYGVVLSTCATIVLVRIWWTTTRAEVPAACA